VPGVLSRLNKSSETSAMKFVESVSTKKWLREENQSLADWLNNEEFVIDLYLA
jgi:hypothetical protein